MVQVKWIYVIMSGTIIAIFWFDSIFRLVNLMNCIDISRFSSAIFKQCLVDGTSGQMVSEVDILKPWRQGYGVSCRMTSITLWCIGSQFPKFSRREFSN